LALPAWVPSAAASVVGVTEIQPQRSVVIQQLADEGEDSDQRLNVSLWGVFETNLSWTSVVPQTEVGWACDTALNPDALSQHSRQELAAVADMGFVDPVNHSGHTYEQFVVATLACRSRASFTLQPLQPAVNTVAEGRGRPDGAEMQSHEWSAEFAEYVFPGAR
jgi:hypothetical protein